MPYNNLPLALDRFIGRRYEMAGIGQLLGTARLVTLIGPAGVGKTRLATEVASAARLDYRDGVALVSLAGITDPRSVWSAVASALGLAEQAQRSLADTVARALSSRRLLMVVDNAEHVIAVTTEMACTLLERCPRLTVLVTSQEPLGLPDEHVWPVQPLAVPALDQRGDDLLLCEAVALFYDRASSVRPGFDPDASSQIAVAEICRRLDGIPLAIELAAALTDSFTPASIASRLDDRLTLLTRGSRAALPRHQKLRAALDWSYNLLTENEQTVFRRLGVFSSGATREAIESVCGDAGTDTARFSASLSGLVNRSLLCADSNHETVRYRMLETVAHYAAERLEASGELSERRARHAQWCLTLAERSTAELTGGEQRLWLEKLDQERNNLTAAVGWALSSGDSNLALRLAGALTLFWRMRCAFSEGRRWLEAALAVSDPDTSLPWAWAAWGAGFLSLMLGEFQVGVAYLQRALAVFRAHDDTAGCARALLMLGNYCVFSAPAKSALSVLQQSVAAAREGGDGWCLAHALALLGLTHLRHGEMESARTVLGESVQVAREAEDAQGLHFALRVLGNVAVREGDYSEAEAALQEALRLTDELGETYGTADALCLLGEVSMGRGQYEKAEALLLEGLALTRQTGSAPAVQETLCTLAKLYCVTGEYTRARRRLDEALAMGGSAGALLLLAETLLAGGNSDEARRRLEEAQAAAASEGAPHLAAAAFHSKGALFARSGDEVQAASYFGQALTLRYRLRDGPGMADSLEAIAGVGLGGRDWWGAARLLGVAQRLREGGGYARPRAARTDYEADVRAVRRHLGSSAFETAWCEGEAFPLEMAVFDSAAKVIAPPELSPSGWDSLTEPEREVAELVGQGLTNKEIASRLFMSPRTVGGHLSHAFAKLNVTSRAQLAREVKRLAEPTGNHGPAATRRNLGGHQSSN